MTQLIRRIARPLVRATLAGAVAASLTLGPPTFANAGNANRACGLLTAAELEAALGGKVSGLKDGGAPGPMGSDAQFCFAETPTARILLRLAKKSGREPAGGAETIEELKKMGIQIAVKTFGPITCSTVIPPKGQEQTGFNTTCSVDKGTQLAAVEVTAKSQKDMVPIEKLRPLAEKMATRF